MYVKRNQNSLENVMTTDLPVTSTRSHDNAIKWKHFPRYWSFVRGMFTGPGEFPAQRPVTRSFDVFFDLHLNKRINDRVNNGEAGDLRRHRGQYDVIVMFAVVFTVSIMKEHSAVGAHL